MCVDYQHNFEELAAYKRDPTTAITKTSPYELDRIFKAAESLSMDSISEKICLLSREKQDEVTSRPVVSVITPTVQSRLAMKYRDLPTDELIRLYRGASGL